MGDGAGGGLDGVGAFDGWVAVGAGAAGRVVCRFPVTDGAVLMLGLGSAIGDSVGITGDGITASGVEATYVSASACAGGPEPSEFACTRPNTARPKPATPTAANAPTALRRRLG